MMPLQSSLLYLCFQMLVFLTDLLISGSNPLKPPFTVWWNNIRCFLILCFSIFAVFYPPPPLFAYSQDMELLPPGCAQVYVSYSQWLNVIVYFYLPVHCALWWKDRKLKVKHCIDVSVWKSLPSVYNEKTLKCFCIERQCSEYTSTSDLQWVYLTIFCAVKRHSGKCNALFS